MKKNKLFKILNLENKFQTQTIQSYNFLKNDIYLKSKNWIFRKRSFAKGRIYNSK